MTNPKEYRHSPKHVQRVSYEERERAKKHGARWNKPLGTRVLSTREPLRGWVARRSAAAAAMSVGAGEARTTRVIDMRRACGAPACKQRRRARAPLFDVGRSPSPPLAPLCVVI